MSSKSFTVTVQFDKSKFVGDMTAKSKRAIAIVASEALKDANYYVRKDTGEMERSSIRASDLDNGTLIWDTPYARKVYTTGNPSTDTNPHASLMWAHKGYAENYGRYNQMIEKIMTEE